MENLSSFGVSTVPLRAYASRRRMSVQKSELLLNATVYVGRTGNITTLDVGRSSKIAEIDVRALKVIDDLPTHLQAKRELFEILRNSQFKNMVERGSIRMEAGVTIADVVKEVKRAVFEADGVTSDARSE